MARNQIKLGADVTSIKRSITDISRTIDKELTRKQGVELFDRETKKFLTEEAGRALKGMQEHMEKLNTQSEKYKSELKDSTKSMEDQIRIRKDLLRVEQQRVDTQKSISRLQKDQQFLAGGAMPGTRGQGAGFLGRMSDKVGNVPILGGLARGAARLGPWGLLAAGGVAAGGFAVTRAMQGFGQYEQTLDERLNLRARGVRGVQGQVPALQRLGYSPNEIIQAQGQGLDVFGRTGVETGQAGRNALQTRMAFARFAGVDAGRLTETFAGTQAAGGFKQANRVEAEFMGTIIAGDLEEAIGPYLEATASLLEQINEDGLGLTAPAIQGIAAIAQQGQVFSPQQAARMISGIDEAIRGAEGDQAAFYMSAFARQGIGGRTLGGAEAAMRGGLFGGNLNRLQDIGIDPSVTGAYQRLGLADVEGATGRESVPFRRVQGILETIQDFTRNVVGEGPGEGATEAERQRFQEQQVVAQDAMMSRVFGIQNPLEARQAFRQLQIMRDALEEGDTETAQEARTKLEELTTDPEQRFQNKLTELMESQDGQLKTATANLIAINQQLGERITPIMIAIREAMASASETINNVAGFFGVDTGQEDRVEAIREGEITPEEVQRMNYDDLTSTLKTAQDALKENREDIEEAKESAINRAIRSGADYTKDSRVKSLKSEGKQISELVKMLSQKLDGLKQSFDAQLIEQKRKNRGIGKGKESSIK